MNDKLGNIEWLSRTLSLKAQSYEVSSGGKADIDWTDKCGVFAKLNGEHLKALACLLAWGDWKDTDIYFKRIVAHLVGIMLAGCEKQNLQLRDSKHTLADLADRMAKMVVYLHLREHMKDYFKDAGKLWFVGIELELGTYRKTWRKFEIIMEDCMNSWQAQIDHEIGRYRVELRKDLVANA